MKEKLLQFLQDSNGENSSKRLAGLSSACLFIFLALIGGLVFLFKEQASEFQETLRAVGVFSFGTLGVTAVEKMIKSKK